LLFRSNETFFLSNGLSNNYSYLHAGSVIDLGVGNSSLAVTVVSCQPADAVSLTEGEFVCEIDMTNKKKDPHVVLSLDAASSPFELPVGEYADFKVMCNAKYTLIVEVDVLEGDAVLFASCRDVLPRRNRYRCSSFCRHALFVLPKIPLFDASAG
jgi:hypothetical protein